MRWVLLLLSMAFIFICTNSSFQLTLMLGLAALVFFWGIGNGAAE